MEKILSALLLEPLLEQKKSAYEEVPHREPSVLDAGPNARITAAQQIMPLQIGDRENSLPSPMAKPVKNYAARAVPIVTLDDQLNAALKHFEAAATANKRVNGCIDLIKKKRAAALAGDEEALETIAGVQHNLENLEEDCSKCGLSSYNYNYWWCSDGRIWSSLCKRCR